MIKKNFFKNLFSDREFYNKLILLTLPIAFQSLMLASVAAADSVMLGRIDQNAMSAVSLATQIQFVQNLFIFAFEEGFVVLGSQYWGKGNKQAVRDVFCIVLRISILVSVITFALCEFIPEKLMWLFTDEPALVEIGKSYLRIAGFSYLLTGVSQCYLTVMKTTDHAGASSAISSFSVILNILLNAVFIFGLFSFKSMGADGAAFATLIARITELILCFVVSMRKEYIRPGFKGLFHINKSLSADFYRITVPLIGGAVLWGVGFTSYTAAMGHMGKDAVAANAVAAVVRDLMCCLCNGVANAGGILVGYALGKGDLEKGKAYGIKAAWISVIIGVLCTVMVIATIPFVLDFMVLTPEAKKYLEGIMIIMGVYMIGRCMNTVIINGIFAAGGDTMFDVYSLAVCMWLISIPLAFLGVFVFNWSAYLVYFFTCFDETVKIPWVIVHFKKYKWVKDLTRDDI